MTEVWKPIPGFESRYEVSNRGRIRSVDRTIMRAGAKRMYKKLSVVLKPRLDKDGYHFVSIYRNSKPHHLKVHRIVAEAFLQKADSKDEVNHKDFDKINNCVENLEWCSHQQNVRHANSNGRHGGRGTKIQAVKDSVVVHTFESTKNAELAGFHRGAIYKVLNGIWKHHKGLQWRRSI